MKKTAAVLFAALALLSCICFFFASCGEEETNKDDGTDIGTDGLAYRLTTDGTYSVSLGRAVYSEEIVIPSTYRGKPVSSIPDGGFADAENIQKITIPSSIRRIGADAFLGSDEISAVCISDIAAWCGTEFSTAASNPLCYSAELYVGGALATDLVIPNGVSRISDYAFALCSGLRSVRIPDGVSSIGVRAFADCKELENVFLGNSVSKIEASSFLDSLNIKYNYYDGALYLGNEENPYRVLVFAVGKDVRSCKMHDDTEAVAAGAFSDCEELVMVSIGKKIKSIGFRAFSDCNALSAVHTPDIVGWCGIDFDGYYANPLSAGGDFYVGGKSVDKIEIPNGVESVGAYAFYNCNAITEVIIPDSVKVLGECAFSYCKSLKSVKIGASCERIPKRAFDHCISLESVDFGINVKTIDEYAFDSCSSIEELDLGASLETVGKAAFLRCAGIRELNIGPSVRTVCEEAFSECEGLRFLKISDGAKTVGARAFYGCKNLMSAELPSTLLTVGSEAFSECFKLAEVINHSALDIKAGLADHGCAGLYAMEVHNSESKLEVLNGFYFYSHNGVNRLLGVAEATKTLVLPSNFNGKDYFIGDYAFFKEKGIDIVLIPKAAKAIGDYAFFECTDLESVSMAEGVASVGAYAFYGCSALTSFTSVASIQKIGESAFAQCSGLFNAKIGDGVVSVGKEAFYKCSSLQSLYVGSRVASIGADAFKGCSSLERVETASLRSWCALEFDTYYSNPLFYALALYENGEHLNVIRIPSGVETVSRYAFYNFRGVVSVVLPKSLKSIGPYAFYGCSHLAEVVNASDLEIELGKASNGYVAEHAVSVHSDAVRTVRVGDFLFYSDGECVYLVSYVGEGSEIVLPSDFDGKSYAISDYAFYRLDVKSVTVPDGVIGIGAHAFFECSRLTDVTVADTVSYIGAYAFAGCERLSSVNMGNGVTEIGAWAFKDCEALGELTLSSSLKKIGAAAFYSCTLLEDVVIPASVEVLGNFLFENCTNLASVSFECVDSWFALSNFERYEFMLGEYGRDVVSEIILSTMDAELYEAALQKYGKTVVNDIIRGTYGINVAQPLNMPGLFKTNYLEKTLLRMN
ncbi:MAG: leucine-rich repeat domain-containing protein [Clostridia bacterium]|nr:leucine-rich repeat domain-containing protein [Clostridia bacterium]